MNNVQQDEVVEVPRSTLQQLQARLQDLTQREAINTKLLGYMENDLNAKNREIEELRAQVREQQRAGHDDSAGVEDNDGP